MIANAATLATGALHEGKRAARAAYPSLTRLLCSSPRRRVRQGYRGEP